jgi:LuxR family transcriptional regulator, maltose regulon positive regulatory protein
MRETLQTPQGTVVAKLAVPRVAQILRRPRILKQIERSLRAGACWLAAPAGYGKTTALVDYLHDASAQHVWFRVDEGDQDIARFFQYLTHSLERPEAIAAMPIFGVEYAEQPREFARLYFRAYFAQLKPGTILVLDDLHYADTNEVRAMLAVMLSELPPTLRCILLSRTLPQEELGDLALRAQLTVIDQSALEFSEAEARNLVKLRLKRTAATIDVAMARGWAVGLVLLAERGYASPLNGENATEDKYALFDVLGRNLFYTLPPVDQDTLLKLNLLPEISAELANALIGSKEAGKLLDRLYQRQLLITRSEAGGQYFQLHDLLRDFLDAQLTLRFPKEQLAQLREKTATILAKAGRLDEAIALALDDARRSLRQSSRQRPRRSRRPRCAPLDSRHVAGHLRVEERALFLLFAARLPLWVAGGGLARRHCHWRAGIAARRRIRRALSPADADEVPQRLCRIR